MSATFAPPLPNPFGCTAQAALDVFEPDASALPQALPCGLDPGQESRVVFQTVIKPVVFGFEANEHPGRSAVPGDEHFFLFGGPKKAGQIVLDL
jgi:hypothetical protein